MQTPSLTTRSLAQSPVCAGEVVVVAFLQRLEVTDSMHRRQAAELPSGRQMKPFDVPVEDHKPAVSASAFQGWNGTIAAV